MSETTQHRNTEVAVIPRLAFERSEYEARIAKLAAP